ALLRVADVDHELGAALPGGPASQPGHLHAHDLEGGGDHAGLDAADQATVLVHGPQGVVQIDAALRDDVGTGGETGLADVEERNDLGVALGNDVAREGGKRRRPRAARVDDGRHPGVDAAQIGMDAVAGDALEHVGVQVDQARGDDLARHLDDAAGLGRRDIARDARNGPALHGDVLNTVEAARRIENSSTSEHEIVHAGPRSY